MVVQANGRIVVAGTAGGNFAVARVHADGLQDSDFNGNGITVFNIGETLAPAFVPPQGTYDTLTSMALQPDGQIVVAGYTNLNATKDGINPVPIRSNGTPDQNGVITNAKNQPVITTGPVIRDWVTAAQVLPRPVTEQLLASSSTFTGWAITLRCSAPTWEMRPGNAYFTTVPPAGSRTASRRNR